MGRPFDRDGGPFRKRDAKARVLNVLGRREEAMAAQKKAIAMGSQVQVHSFARGLQAKGQQGEALALFRSNIGKDPHSWIAHNEASRIAVANGDFDTAVREMKLAVETADRIVQIAERRSREASGEHIMDIRYSLLTGQIKTHSLRFLDDHFQNREATTEGNYRPERCPWEHGRDAVQARNAFGRSRAESPPVTHPPGLRGDDSGDDRSPRR
jgi:tetratricopeptide (TPR) repeat protein